MRGNIIFNWENMYICIHFCVRVLRSHGRCILLQVKIHIYILTIQVGSEVVYFFTLLFFLLIHSIIWCLSVFSLTTERFICCLRNKLPFVAGRHIAHTETVAYLHATAYTYPRIYCRSVVHATVSIYKYRLLYICIFVCWLYIRRCW